MNARTIPPMTGQQIARATKAAEKRFGLERWADFCGAVLSCDLRFVYYQQDNREALLKRVLRLANNFASNHPLY